MTAARANGATTPRRIGGTYSDAACRSGSVTARVADKTVAFRPFPGQSFSLRGSDADAGIVGELDRSREGWQAQEMINDELRLITSGDNENFVHGFVLASEGSCRRGFDKRRTKPQVAKNTFCLLTGMAEQ